MVKERSRSMCSRVNITSKSFGELRFGHQENFHLTCSEGFEYNEEEVTVAAGYMGRWLADGNRYSTVIFSNHEIETITILSEYSEALDMDLVYVTGLAYKIKKKMSRTLLVTIKTMKVRNRIYMLLNYCT
jgi:hypothetical protein